MRSRASLWRRAYRPSPTSPTRGEDDSQTIVYLAEGKPIIVKVHLRMDGKSHRAAWRAMMDELFGYLDLDSNGELSKKEAALAPPAVLLASQAGFVGGSAGVGMDADQDGIVTRDEMRTFYRTNGLQPFQINGNNQNVWSEFRLAKFDAVVLGAVNGGGRASADSLNTRLFALLDKDKDGKLSKKELAAASAILAKLDKDEDEMLTKNEVMGNRQTTSSDAELLAFTLDSYWSGSSGDSRFVVLGDGRADRTLARRLLAQYAKDGKKKLEVKQVGLTNLDRDADGWLDQEELARIRDESPDIELRVRLGKREKNESFMQVLRKSKSLRKVEATAQGATVTIQNAQLELKGGEEQKQDARKDFLAEYQKQFKAADTDNNGYLDKAESRRSLFYRGPFAVMDRDADGMLYEKEVTTYLDRLTKLRQSVLKGCVTLTLRDDGKGLFDLIDTNNDGRLSVREIRHTSTRLLALDHEGEGHLTLAKVPRRYSGSFEEGAGMARGYVKDLVLVRSLRMGRESPPPPPVKKGPTWFQKMDRNRDGDVSRREWLGEAKDFAEVDADRDGLISLAEAEAYDQRKRE